MTTDLIKSASAIREAVDILSKGGAYVRALAVHHVGCGTRCASCSERYPCSIARWATAAREQVQRRAAEAARDAERAATALAAHRCTPDPAGVATEPMRGVS